jgi:hypothetical protein
MSPLFDDGVIAICEQLLTHGFGIFPGGEGADLDVKQLILWFLTNGDVISATSEGGYKDVRIFTMRDCSDLDECRPGR